MIKKILDFLIRTAAALLCAASLTCCEAEVTDTTEFALYYYGVTDIAPSMSFTLSAPSYIGPEPSCFSISGVKLDGEPSSADAFAINASTGSITIIGSDALECGLYCLSVDCIAGGRDYSFPDIVSLRMLPGVPDGITVEPSEIMVEYADVVAGKELPTACVTTDGNHISISSYSVANVRKDGVALGKNTIFDISASGEITIDPGSADLQAGVYVVDLRLVTAAADMTSEEGLFADALTLIVTSAPLAVSYASNPARVEYGYGHTSSAADLTGSAEGLVFRLKSASPSTAPISVAPSSGVITLSEGNSLEVGTVCRVNLIVSNIYGTTEFYDAYQITVVDYIAPIGKFSYSDVSTVRGEGFTNSPSELDGDEVTFAFGDLDEALAANLSIDTYTGEVVALKGHTIPVGEYTVTVVASNSKSEATASFTLTVGENPYYFTYILWGNDLGLTPASDYANQFRQPQGTSDYTVPILQTDLSEDGMAELTLSVERLSGGGAISADPDGSLTIKFRSGISMLYCDVFIVTATSGEGKPGSTTVRVPVFISTTVDGTYMEYTPFVFQVNPRTGGRSTSPALVGVDDPSTFLADYRRNATYYNFNGPDTHLSGQISTDDTSLFIDRMWYSYYVDILGGTTVNYGARAPMSYYDNSDLSLALGYTDASDLRFVINPNRWIYDGYYADGFWMGQFTYATDGNSSSLSSGSQMWPIVIWFGADF